MARKRWGPKRATAPRRKRGAGSDRYVKREFATVYRDPATGLLLQIGPDEGPPERRNHGLGVVTGKRLAFNELGKAFITTGATVVAPCVLDAMREGGFLAVAPGRVWACPASRQAAGALLRRRYEAAEHFAALCRAAGVVRRVTGGYEFRTAGGTREENAKALRARRILTRRGRRLGPERVNRLIDVLALEVVPDLPAALDFLGALDTYADLLALARAEGEDDDHGPGRARRRRSARPARGELRA